MGIEVSEAKKKKAIEIAKQLQANGDSALHVPEEWRSAVLDVIKSLTTVEQKKLTKSAAKIGVSVENFMLGRLKSQGFI